MLQLKEITKSYPVAGGEVQALKGISLQFRKNEFVSILGASGCGKTTLLNIIGGLDKYTSGDLIIAGKSTKEYKDRDWDTYRNHSIGFIFQSYHLIPHQTILQNVELALTISGVSKAERRARAVEALKKVGLDEKLNVRPNQLSGGQAQRVAIARALINDPEIVLADEPTGALDSKTSVQIMDLLKEISRDRLVIMVTHNPELAEAYSTRIIRLLDGLVTDDSDPYYGDGNPFEYVKPNDISGATAENSPKSGGKTAGNEEDAAQTSANSQKGKKNKSAMSTGMAFSLSLKNLLSKGKRTAMVSVAGSIGIIGVSMVLAISSGVRGYIASMEDDMLSGFPVSVTETAINYESLMDQATAANVKVNPLRLGDRVYINSLIERLMGLGGAQTTNTITKDYIDYVEKMPAAYYNALQYDYGINSAHNIYTNFKLDAADAGEEVSVTGIRTMYSAVLKEVGKKPDNEKYAQFAKIIPTVSTFEELPDNYNYVLNQYDVLASCNGKTEKLTDGELKEIFQSKDSIVMVINDNATTDLTLGQYGYFTQEEFLAYAERANDVSQGAESSEHDGLLSDYLNGQKFSFFLDEGEESTFKWYPNDTIYKQTTDLEKNFLKAPAYTLDGEQIPAEYKYLPYSADFDNDRNTENDVDLKVKVILQKKKGVSYGCLSTGMYYTKALADHALKTGRASEIVRFINNKESKKLDGLPFIFHYTYEGKRQTGGDLLTAASGGMMSEMMNNMMGSMLGGGSSADTDMFSSYRVKTSMLGGGDLPTKIYIYPLDFDSKDLVTDYLDGWNDLCEDEKDKVNCTDQVGLIITMVNTMIEMITIALVAFTALSLVVSTVMVGIITYVSVVERIKEIGILRAVGARKKDIKRLFNAETFIIGLSAGTVGIVTTYLISFIINMVVGSLFGVWTICSLPILTALIMIAISVCLTLISGLIPAASAAKKDPVVALRTE